MDYGQAIVFEDLASLEIGQSHPVIYDQPIGMQLLYEDPKSGAEHYLVRYPAGLKTQLHRHTAAHTIVVLEGRLKVNDQVVGPGAYCHFPAREPMFHAPVGGACLFINMFDGPSDVESLE
jgi:quercetin dioxygenase-like cupin family protein